MSLFKMKDEPVSDRTPFLGIGNLVLELEDMGRGKKRDGKVFSFVTFKVLESDRADQAAGTSVTKWIQDGSFSCQKDLKCIIGAVLNQPVSTLEIGDVVPLFYTEEDLKAKREPAETPCSGSGLEMLKGRKVRVSGKFPIKKDKDTGVETIGTYPNHDFFAIDPPL